MYINHSAYRPEYLKYRGNQVETVQSALNQGCFEGIDMITKISESISLSATQNAINFFDVVAPALLEMSGAVDTAASLITTTKTPGMLPAPPELDEQQSSNIISAVYDDFNAGNDSNVQTTANVEMGYDGTTVYLLLDYELRFLISNTKYFLL